MVGQLQPAGLLADRAGECSTFVAEQLAFEKGLGQRRTVDGHQWAAGARAVGMDGVRDELLAGTAFAAEEHRGVGSRDARDETIDGLHRRALADQVVIHGKVAAQPRVVGTQPLRLFDAFDRQPADQADGGQQLQFFLCQRVCASGCDAQHARSLAPVEQRNRERDTRHGSVVACEDGDSLEHCLRCCGLVDDGGRGGRGSHAGGDKPVTAGSGHQDGRDICRRGLQRMGEQQVMNRSRDCPPPAVPY